MNEVDWDIPDLEADFIRLVGKAFHTPLKLSAFSGQWTKMNPKNDEGSGGTEALSTPPIERITHLCKHLLKEIFNLLVQSFLI